MNATKQVAAGIQSAATTPGNGDAAGIQPAAPVEQSAPTSE